ncbi:MAG: hypothetical protein EOO92_24055 [Pedobacter sp.]|nr:MAG: hypothetical protein EOO92_24055 [Pedobacter sp.]
MMIYWYFNSYNNLVKTYINGRDFWRPVLDRSGSDEQLDEQELPDYISDIFQEQFNAFFNDPELQKMILWQVSEPNPLLREISDERESQADPIIKLTDAHFDGSNINFRAVLALMLGGIYYVVWHASTNRSKICGIDINDERDREALQKAIRQVIEAVWNAGGSTQEV